MLLCPVMYDLHSIVRLGAWNDRPLCLLCRCWWRKCLTGRVAVAAGTGSCSAWLTAWTRKAWKSQCVSVVTVGLCFVWSLLVCLLCVFQWSLLVSLLCVFQWLLLVCVCMFQCFSMIAVGLCAFVCFRVFCWSLLLCVSVVSGGLCFVCFSGLCWSLCFCVFQWSLLVCLCLYASVFFHNFCLPAFVFFSGHCWSRWGVYTSVFFLWSLLVWQLLYVSVVTAGLAAFVCFSVFQWSLLLCLLLCVSGHCWSVCCVCQ